MLHCATHHSMHRPAADASQGVLTNTLRTRKDLLKGLYSCMNANLQAPVAAKCKAGTLLLNISASVYHRLFTLGWEYEQNWLHGVSVYVSIATPFFLQVDM